MKYIATTCGNPSTTLRMTHPKKNTGKACGKIILSGEYAVVLGYPGLAIPAPLHLTATFEPNQNHPIEIIWPEAEGTLWIPYLKRIIDLCIEHCAPYAGTLTINNAIPLGRGMGSSTALVIAVTRCLLKLCHIERSRNATQQMSCFDYAHHDTLKKIALSIEETLNPNGSGLDFEVIWNEKPILFHKGKTEILQDTSILVYWCTRHAVLIDTGKPNETTTELVAWVKEKLCHTERSRSATRCHGSWFDRAHHDTELTMTPQQALQTIGHCTERLLAGESPLTVFHDHHRAQVALGVVPEHIQKLIADIEQAGGSAKVIGAGGRSGGGGIVLACGSIQKIRHLPDITKNAVNQSGINFFTLGHPTQHQPALQS